ncbi:MAG: ABC transporter ATP-binding protein [Deltaproteobacteria bacterium HGW-Deltaproteobacteria-15]|jgi:branched-chain amino acid transport system ATP-binding protein|nr:MAG: ABC transporter ATP-binding protein [Deltaproteobacteria bacterium HGW-Deltaproteobacteria-15]
MLRTENLNVFYDELQALIEVSVHVREGDLLVIIGSNGSGKTTLLRTISGLNRPRGGRIFFQGEPIEEEATDRICGRGINHVPEGRKLFPQMTVYENLEMGAYLASERGMPADHLEEVFRTFPVLRRRTKQLAGTLSGGEQQMLAVGRALMAKPRLLMLDEPTLGLAPKAAYEIYSVLVRLNRDGLTILLVSQDVLQALKIANRAYVLENGRISMEGSGSDLLGNPKVKEAYLGI